MRLPDLEAWAIFVKVVQLGSFSDAASELGISKATVSKALQRLEERLGARLIQRTSRRLAVTDIGRQCLMRAERMLAEAEGAESDATNQASAPRGRVRLTAPVHFGVEHVAPLLPELFSRYPDISLDLHLTDATVDLIGEGYDIAVRIANLADSSLRVRRLCAIRRVLVGAPDYFAAHGTPEHPRDLADHACFTYMHDGEPARWRFAMPDGTEFSMAPSGPLRGNSAEAFLPLLRAGQGIAILPEFMVWRDVDAGLLVPALCATLAPPLMLNLVTPPGGPRPARVTAVLDLLARRLSGAPWARQLPPELSQKREAATA